MDNNGYNNYNNNNYNNNNYNNNNYNNNYNNNNYNNNNYNNNNYNNNYGNQGGYQGGYQGGMPNGNYGYNGGTPNGNYGYNGGMPQQSASYGFALASLLCGILSILCGCGTAGISAISIPLITVLVAGIPAIMSIIFGIVAKKKDQLKGMRIAGIICGCIGLLIAIGMLIYFLFLAGVVVVQLISDYT